MKKTIFIFQNFFSVHGCVIASASVSMLLILAGCAGAYKPVPKAKPTNAPVVESSMSMRSKRLAPSTLPPGQKSTPVTTQLTETSGPKPTAPTAPTVQATPSQSPEPAEVVAKTPVEVVTEVVTEAPAQAPTVTTTPVSRDPGEATRQNLVLERAGASHAQVVLIGDSITEGWEGAPDQLHALVGLRSAANLGVGGDRTQHVLWRLEQAPLIGIQPKVIVLMIGTNNIYDDSAEDIVAGIRAIVALMSAQCPHAGILILDIPPRGVPLDSARAKITQINTLLAQCQWPANARFVCVSGQFLDTASTIDPTVMPDLLHFSQKGYAIWAASIKPELDLSLAAQPLEVIPTTTHP